MFLGTLLAPARLVVWLQCRSLDSAAGRQIVLARSQSAAVAAVAVVPYLFGHKIPSQSVSELTEKNKNIILFYVALIKS